MSEAAAGSDLTPFRARFIGLVETIGLDGEKTIFATQVALTGGLTMFMAFLVNLPYTYWALLTLPLVLTQRSGNTVWRSAARVGGTLTGALVILFMVGFFAQSGLTMIACLALWIVGCGFLARFAVGFDAYAYGTAGLTALVIGIDTGPNADAVFGFALWRSTETIIPVIAAFIVMLVVFPRSIADELHETLSDTREKVLALLSEALQPGERHGAGQRAAICAGFFDLFTKLRSLKLERSHAVPSMVRMNASVSRMAALFVSAEALSATINEAAERAGPNEANTRIETLREEMKALVDDLPTDDRSAEAADRHADRLRAFAERIDRLEAMEQVAMAENEALRRRGLLRWQMHETAMEAVRFLEAEAAMADPGRPSFPSHPVDSRYPDISAAIQMGLRPAIIFTLFSLFWIFSAWSNGSILALITGALCLLIPTIVPRAGLINATTKIFLGFLCGGFFGLLLSVFMPNMTGFSGFLTLFMPLLFVIFYVCSGPNLPIGLGATIMLAVSFQPSNQQVYDTIQIVNIVATLSLMPAGFLISQTVFFPMNENWLRRHLRRATTKLLRRAARGDHRGRDNFVAQTLDVAADYGGDLDADDAYNRQLIHRSRHAAHIGLEMIELNRLRKAGLLPAALDDALDTLRRSLDAAGHKTLDAVFDEELAAIDEARRQAASAIDPDPPSSGGAGKQAGGEGSGGHASLSRSACLRFAVACESLDLAIRRGMIALPPRGSA